MLDVIDLHIEIEDHIIPETLVYDFDLSIKQGEIVGIVGESGSGKTMSALAIAGLLSRQEMKKQGTIMFEGEDLLTIPRSKLRSLQGNDISMIFQEPMTSLNPVKTIGWQVEESLRIHHTKLTEKERYDKVIESLRAVELDEPEKLYDMYPHELSGGMRQRVMIAAAIISEPKLLIADEPTTALDVTIQSQIIDLLRKINSEFNTAILFISHDLSLVRSLCDRVLVMHKGRVVEANDVDEVFFNPKEDYTKNLIKAIPKLVKLSDGRGVKDTPILKVSNFSAGYKQKMGRLASKTSQKLIIKDISFEMYEGEILGLVGESGCGKSTLGKSILGMLDNTEGTIEHYSEHPQMIFQDPYSSLNPAYSIGWILEEPLRIRSNMPDAQRNEKVIQMLRLVGLDESYAKRKPSELSGGQRQRVCIALSLMLDPKLIIADEPVSALDVTVQSQILELLVKLNRDLGVAILFISHDLKVVYEICSRIMVMKDGRIIEQGRDVELYNNPKEEYTKELLKSAGIEFGS